MSQTPFSMCHVMAATRLNEPGDFTLSSSKGTYSFLQNFLAEGLLTFLEETRLFHLFLFSGKLKE